MRKHCDTCIRDDFGDYCKHCKWPAGKPPSEWKPNEWWTPDTNADRIRAMSDEELFVAIQKTYIGKAQWCDHHCKLDDDCSCSACLKEWLKQPVEVE